MFKRTCQSISGTRYRAIKMGPVPSNYGGIFDYMVREGLVEIVYHEFPSGAVGEQFRLPQGRRFDPSLFTQEELDVLAEVSAKFGQMDTSDIVELSHMERAWAENHAQKGLISYMLAFDLKA
jgi:hypothetical protein